MKKVEENMDIQKFPLCMADIPVDLKHPNRTLVAWSV